MKQDYFEYHHQRTLKKLQDQLDVAKSTRATVDIAGVIDRLLWTAIERDKTEKLKDGWEYR